MHFKDLHRNIKIRIIVLFVRTFSSMLIVPFMPIYFSNAYSPKIAGIVMSVSVIITLFSNFYGGYIASYHNRKKILSNQAFIQTLALFLMAFVNISSFPHKWAVVCTLVLFIIHNITVSLSVPAMEAMVIDLSTSQSRRLIYTISYWVGNMSMAIGTIIGAILFENNLYILMFITAICSFIAFILLNEYLEDDTIKTKIGFSNMNISLILKEYKPLLKDRLFIKFVMAGILSLGLSLQLGNFIAIRLSNELDPMSFPIIKEITGVEIYGFLRVENTILVIVLGIVLSKLLERFSKKSCIKFGLLIFTLGWFFMGFSNNFIVLIIAMFIISIGEIIYMPVRKELLADITPVDKRSQYVAFNSINSRGAQMIGSLGIILGAMVPSYVMSVIYLIIGMFSIYLFNNIFKQYKVDFT